DPGISSGFSEAWVPSLAVERAVHRTLWWHAEAGFHRYRGYGREADWASLGLGLRWRDTSAGGFGAYLEACPTLFGFRWIGRMESATELPGEFRDLTRVVPGLVTGFGLRFRGNKTVAMNYG